MKDKLSNASPLGSAYARCSAEAALRFYDRGSARLSRTAWRRFGPIWSCPRPVAGRLVACRWPNGFRCPGCGDHGSYLLVTRDLLQWRACRRQTSVTAGTVLDRTRPPLPLCHPPGFSALQLQRQLGLARYETAWTMLHKLRRAIGLCPSPRRDVSAADSACPSATGSRARSSWTRPMSAGSSKGGAAAGSATARSRSWPVPWRSAAAPPAHRTRGATASLAARLAFIGKIPRPSSPGRAGAAATSNAHDAVIGSVVPPLKLGCWA